jgi:hypothetical protein
MRFIAATPSFDVVYKLLLRRTWRIIFYVSTEWSSPVTKATPSFDGGMAAFVQRWGARIAMAR